MVQIALCVVLTIVSLETDSNIERAKTYEALVLEHRLSFQQSATTTRHLFEAAESPKQNIRLIKRIQQRLQLDTEEARSVASRIKSAAERKGSIPFLSMRASMEFFTAVRPQLDEFIQSLEVLSTMQPENLHLVRNYANRVDMAVAPSGLISRCVHALTQEAAADAARVVKNLRILRTIILLVVITFICLLAFFLIFPALSKLMQTLDREKQVRIKPADFARRDHMTKGTLEITQQTIVRIHLYKSLIDGL